MNEGLINVEDEELVKSIRSKPDTIDNPISKRERDILERWNHVTNEELDEMIASGHAYHFVGKVGQFCPIKPGCGGGLLLRETENKKTGEKGYAAATGSKGYRWLESEMVREKGLQDSIDRSYYDAMVDEAIHTIVAYGDYSWFVSDDPYVGPSFEKGEYMDKPVYTTELPWS